MSAQRRRRVMLVMYKEAAKNPIARMYVGALQEIAEISIACSDPTAAAAAFPGTNTHDFRGSEFLNNVRRRLMQARQALAHRRTSPGLDQEILDSEVDRSSEPSTRRVDKSLLRSDLGSALSFALSSYSAGRPDVVIAIDGDALLPALAVARMSAAKLVYVMNEVYPNQYITNSGIVRGHLAAVECYGARRASRCLVMDRSWQTLLVRRYGISRRNCEIIRICPPVPAVRAPELKPGQKCRFYYHGAYVRGRGLESLIRAMLQVDGGELHMRGVGDLECELKVLSNDLGLDGKVFFHEPLPVADLPLAATNFHVGVSVACSNTANGRFLLGFKTMENISAGLALICPSSRALTPFVERHDVGMTFEGCDVSSIVRAFRHCIENVEDVNRWQRSARRHAEAEYNDQVQGAKLRAVIGDLLAITISS
jgi:glycosyltransferase involved in cell wall biosynthesis